MEGWKLFLFSYQNLYTYRRNKQRYGTSHNGKVRRYCITETGSEDPSGSFFSSHREKNKTSVRASTQDYITGMLDT